MFVCTFYYLLSFFIDRGISITAKYFEFLYIEENIVQAQFNNRNTRWFELNY
jgi:hypothetical protein